MQDSPLLFLSTLSAGKGTNRNVVEEALREAVREWILSDGSRFKHDNPEKSCSSALCGKEKVPKNFLILESADWKGKNGRAPIHDVMNPRTVS